MLTVTSSPTIQQARTCETEAARLSRLVLTNQQYPEYCVRLNAQIIRLLDHAAAARQQRAAR